ncbi:MAG: ThiF family adenylyltransferase [Nitrospirae bacterium]|nr:ThiF family adenylyltransferase [Nitrospirota bacterium]
MTPEEENGRTLAVWLGIDEEKAIELLDTAVLITPNQECNNSLFLAERLIEILSRTVKKVTSERIFNPSVEVVIGNAIRKTSALAVYVGITDSHITISYYPIITDQNPNVHPVFLIIGACHAAAMAVNGIIGEYLPYRNQNPIILDYKKMYGSDLELFYTKAFLGEAFLAGAGAIGNALLYSMQFFDIEGKLNVVDPDIVSDGNLNRCLFFSESDISNNKVEVLVRKAQPYFPRLKLIPYPSTLRDVPLRTGENWLRRLIVGVDSRRARRSLQNELPGEVFDASTTDIREVVLHFHRQPTKGACLSCIYFQEEGELSHELHVAEVLGVSVEEVQKGLVSKIAAAKICAMYPDLAEDDLVNKAYDSLFKQLCGQGRLKMAEDKQVLAPLAFVSVLAGAYLAIEIVRRIQKKNVEDIFNHWKVSPWHSPNMRLCKVQPKRIGCEFCGNEIFMNIADRLWKW